MTTEEKSAPFILGGLNTPTGPKDIALSSEDVMRLLQPKALFMSDGVEFLAQPKLMTEYAPSEEDIFFELPEAQRPIVIKKEVAPEAKEAIAGLLELPRQQMVMLRDLALELAHP